MKAFDHVRVYSWSFPQSSYCFPFFVFIQGCQVHLPVSAVIEPDELSKFSAQEKVDGLADNMNF